jgi:hypothetical protein
MINKILHKYQQSGIEEIALPLQPARDKVENKEIEK